MHTLFNNFLENELNEAQQQAVTDETGSVLVVAGAGSGKTRVITARITHLIINKQVPASSIVALTFTNKAATEMKERITHFLGTHTDLPFVGTFHSYCVQLLKRNQEHLSSPFFSILDEDDQQKLLHGIIQRSDFHKHITAKKASYQISQMKNHTADPAKPALERFTHPFLKNIFDAYETEKRASKCLDFDDLLLESLSLLIRNSVVKRRFQDTIRHILVDEYQDTNVVQHELLKAMALDKKELAIDSVCVVGDEDQSIYSWRGATVTNMAHFKTTFPGTNTIKLEQNYRSVIDILDTANEVIQNNTCRTPKQLWSTKNGSDRIRNLVCLTEYQEARAIAECLQAKEKKELNTIGILYRTHTQSRPIEEALLKESIPYRIIGGIQFYERKEIKDLLAYLKIVANPFDRVSFFRVINTPTRGLGDKFEAQLYDDWSNEPFATWYDMIEKYITHQTCGKTKTITLSTFVALFTNIEPMSLTSSALEKIIERTNYIAYIKESNEPQDAQARIDNIKELMEAIKHFEAQGTTTIASFLEEVALMQEKMNKQNRNAHAVSLMTLHAAKGLEFSIVILAGLEEGLLPSSRSLHVESAIEEERRLFYVGITRARDYLLITNTKNRYSYGKMTDQFSSRFLSEIPTSLMPRQDCSYWNQLQLSRFFSDWFKTKHTEPSSIYIPAQPAIEAVPQKKQIAPTFRPSPKKVSDFPQTSYNEKLTPTNHWQKNQPVHHQAYGTGIVQDVETKEGGEKIFVTVRFKSGVKKIMADFLQKT